MSHDVTGNLIFGKDIEVFCDYIAEETEEEVDYWRDQEDIILSKGALEIKRPLPILNALSKNFIKTFRENKVAFTEEHNPDKNMIPIILKQTIKDLKFQSSHTNEDYWINPKSITAEEYLFQNDIKDNEVVEFPLTFEIIQLITYATLHYKGAGTRSRQQDFSDLINEYSDYLLYLSREINNPGYLFSQRIKELTFRPVSIATDDMPNEEPAKFMFATEGKAGILSLAWAELYFAKTFDMPISVCTYCGKIYSITKNPKKSTCDNDSCKKEQRKERDQQNRLTNPEDEREKDRIRQQRLRDKKKTKTLFSKGKSIEEIRKIINSNPKNNNNFSNLRTTEEIKNWINY